MRLINRHRLWQMAVDAALVAVAWWATFRCSSRDTARSTTAFWEETIAAVVIVKLAVFLFSGSYNKWWRYISLRDVQVLARSVVSQASSSGSRSHPLRRSATSASRAACAVLDLLLTLMRLARRARASRAR